MLKQYLFEGDKMIKGVTKNIIEINPRNHDYFEKLIIILKNIPDTPDEDELQRNAFLMIGQTPPSIINKHSDNIKMILCTLIGAVISLLCCIVIRLFV